MRLISRLEEIILLSIWKLQENAYGISILEEVKKATGRSWLTGSIYASLGRLLKRGLKEMMRVNKIIWASIPPFEVKD